MARTPLEPRLLRLSDFEPGEAGDTFALLVKKDRGQTRDGKPFFRAAFRDAQRSVTVMIWLDGGWFDDCEQHWQPGAFYKLRGRYYENQFGPHLELEKIRPVEPADAEAGFDPLDFQEQTRFDVDAMFTELLDLAAQHIVDPALLRLTTELLHEHADVLKILPAATRNHHTYRGGFVEHVLSVTQTAIFLAEKYRTLYPQLSPPLSKCLVAAGAMLHDIGKGAELSVGPSGADYTPAGRLIGHLVLGRDLIRAKAAEIPEFNAETLLRLEHILLSHQGIPEWGSPTPPSTPEALLVHYADDIDAKFEMMAAALATPGDDPFTSRDHPLRRRLFRGLPSAE